MFARSTTIQSDPQDIERGIAYVRDEVEPRVSEIEGCAGLSLLVDHGTGRSIVTTSWDTEEHLQASRPAVLPLRDRGAQLMSGTPEVQEWEVLLMHRVRELPDDACCRLTWLKIEDPSLMEESHAAFRSEILPRIEQLSGFCSFSLLADRQSGLTVGTTTFASRADLQASSGAATTLRARAADVLHGEVTTVAEMDLMIHHLRVPELV